MAFDWQAYIRLARELGQLHAEGEQREAAVRSAVSRAYLGTFCHVRNSEQEHHSFQPKGKGDHGALKAHLRNTHKRRFAEMMQQLQEWREACDYEDDAPYETYLEKAIEQAEKIVSRF